MKEFFHMYPMAAWSLVSVMVAGLVIMMLWQQLKWWWLNTWYSFPVIGKISRLSRDINMEKNDSEWFKSERALCRDYKNFIRVRDRHEFDENINYLNKARDLGRKETPRWIWILTISTIFVEAMGFAYVLAGFTIPGASENMQQYGALGIAFLISIILVAFTHLSGHELFQSSQISNARREWTAANKYGNLDEPKVTLTASQNIDKDQPSYVQFSHRINGNVVPSYKITTVTIVFVLIVAIFSAYVRGTVLEQQLLMETTGKTAESSLALPAEQDGLNLSTTSDDSALPAADVAEQNKAVQKADAEGINNQRHGGWGTFVVLAFVFVFLQILGIIFGFRWGFAGIQSADAYRRNGGGRYASYSELLEHTQEIVDIAQAKLESLQQKLMDYNTKTGTSGIHTKKTFRDFLKEERNNTEQDRVEDRKKAAQRELESTPISFDQSLNIEGALTADEILAKIDVLPNADAKRDYMMKLPADLRNQAAAMIKHRKAEAAEKAKKDVELDGLFD